MKLTREDSKDRLDDFYSKIRKKSEEGASSARIYRKSSQELAASSSGADAASVSSFEARLNQKLANESGNRQS